MYGAKIIYLLTLEPKSINPRAESELLNTTAFDSSPVTNILQKKTFA